MSLLLLGAGLLRFSKSSENYQPGADGRYFLPNLTLGVFWPFGGPYITDGNDNTSWAENPFDSNGTFEQRITSKELQDIVNAGYDGIRLQVMPGPWLQAMLDNDSERVAELDDYLENAIQSVISKHVGVVITPFFTGYAGWDDQTPLKGVSDSSYLNFKALMVHWAQKFKKFDPNYFAIETYNEPPSEIVGNWENDIQPDLFAALRQELPNHTIIVTGSEWSSGEKLITLDPEDYDDNTIYSYHPLRPSIVSMQGYPFSNYKYIEGLHWPPNPSEEALAISSMESLVDADSNLDSSQKTSIKNQLTSELEMYFENPLDKNFINWYIEQINDWCDSNNIPYSAIYAGEYGMTRSNSEYSGGSYEDRIQFYADWSDELISAGHRRSPIHLDTYDYGITDGIGAGIGTIDPNINHAIMYGQVLEIEELDYGVEVEPEGWSIAVTGTWSETLGAFNFSGDDRTEGAFMNGSVDQFPLDPNNEPKVVLRVKRQGYTRNPDNSVKPSVNDIQEIIATKVIRKPYPDQTELDEVDNLDGTRTIRLSLSEYIYEDDEIVEVNFQDGWKFGETGGTVSTNASNNSTAPLPVAISRVIQPGFELVRGTTEKTFEYLIASRYPRHFGIFLHQAVAGASVTITDGTNTVGPFWGKVGTSDRGDEIRCWKFDTDLEGLNAGPVSVNFTSYPWIGKSRSTGSSHSTDATHGLPVAWDAPHMVCYDPDGDYYLNKYVYVDAANGTGTVASVTVADSLAAAKLGTAAADVSIALQALYALKYTLPTSNGWDGTSGSIRAIDWGTIVLAPGVQAWGTTAEGLNSRTRDGRLVVRGDPDNADPRSNCILRTGGTSPGNIRSFRYWFEDLTIEQGENVILGGAQMTHIENVEVRGKEGFETGNSTPAIFNGASPAGYALFSMSRSTWWKFATILSGTRQRFLLMRSCAIAGTADSIVHVNCTKPDDGYADRTSTAFGGWSTASSSVTDAIIWGCAAYGWQGEVASPLGAKVAGSGTIADPHIVTRLAIVNTLGEGSAGRLGGARFIRFGANPVQVSQSVFEGLTVAGYGANIFYDGGVDTPSAQSRVRLEHRYNSFRNNAVARMAIKGDIFLSDGSLTGNWPHLYGVGYAGNVHANGTPSDASNFQYAFYGIGSLTNTDYEHAGDGGFLGFVDARSGDEGLGWGDYRPDEGSPLIDRANVSNIDVDISNVQRSEIHDTGAMES